MDRRGSWWIGISVLVAGALFSRGILLGRLLVQHATDVTHVATFLAGIPCTKCQFTLEGALSASVVHFRVAAIDPSSKTGMTAWSDWVGGTVR